MLIIHAYVLYFSDPHRTMTWVFAKWTLCACLCVGFCTTFIRTDTSINLNFTAEMDGCICHNSTTGHIWSSFVEILRLMQRGGTWSSQKLSILKIAFWLENWRIEKKDKRGEKEREDLPWQFFQTCKEVKFSKLVWNWFVVSRARRTSETDGKDLLLHVTSNIDILGNLGRFWSNLFHGADSILGCCVPLFYCNMDGSNCSKLGELELSPCPNFFVFRTLRSIRSDSDAIDRNCEETETAPSGRGVLSPALVIGQKKSNFNIKQHQPVSTSTKKPSLFCYLGGIPWGLPKRCSPCTQTVAAVAWTSLVRT